jgi:hypothetical protein
LALLFDGTSQARTYRPTDGGSVNTFNIARVQFAGVDNSTGDDKGYVDFTGQSAQVEQLTGGISATSSRPSRRTP